MPSLSRRTIFQRPRQSQQPISEPLSALPPYQSPSAPLTPTYVHALSTLPISHPTKPLKAHLKRANTILSEVAADLNEVSAHRDASVQRKRDAIQAKGIEHEGPIPGETEAKDLRRKVEVLTKMMEEKVRAIIDVQACVEAGEEALKDVHDRVELGGGRIGAEGRAATQSTLGASQFRSRRTRDGDEDDDGNGEQGSEEEDDEEDPGTGVVRALKRKAEEHDNSYGALSLTERYARHNNYIGFKNFVHDAQNPGEEKPPLPHASTWFGDSGPNLQPGSQVGVGEEAESDIEAVTERVSIKCPLTLLPMKDPVTSKRCKHSFEKEAILEMISHSSLTIGGSSQRRGARDGTAAIKCPVCQIVITAADLDSDPALKRKIARIQQHQRQRQEEGLDEDDTMHDDSHPRAEEVDSGDEAAPSGPPIARNIKAERFSSVAPGILQRRAPEEEDDNQDDGENEEDGDGDDGDDEDVRRPARKRSEPSKSSAMIVDMEDEEEVDDSELYE